MKLKLRAGCLDVQTGVYYDLDRDELFIIERIEPHFSTDGTRLIMTPRYDVEFSDAAHHAVAIEGTKDYPFIGDL